MEEVTIEEFAKGRPIHLLVGARAPAFHFRRVRDEVRAGAQGTAQSGK